MPSPIGSSTENWGTDDDRMSTGHSGGHHHTSGSVSRSEGKLKPEEEPGNETPKISESDSGSHTTDEDDPDSSSDSSDASSDDSDSDSDGGKFEEISQDELQEIQQVCSA